MTTKRTNQPKHNKRDRVRGEQIQQQASAPVLVGAYIRVSTMTEDKISPELQRRDLDIFLERKEAETGRPWVVVRREEDLDVSGGSFARAGIQSLLAAMRSGEIETVITYRWDRFGRNLREALNYLDEVEKEYGGSVLSVSEDWDPRTPEGGYMRNNTLAMAEMQRNQIGAGWKRALRHRVEHGLPPDGQPRYGYLYHRSTRLTSRNISVQCAQGCDADECQTGYIRDPDTASVVERVFREYLAGVGMSTIADRLNRDGVPTPGMIRWGRLGKPEKAGAGAWRTKAISDLLDNDFYAGYVSMNGVSTEGVHDAIVDAETWDRFQAIRAEKSMLPYKARAPRWSLAGIAVCGECGTGMTCSSTNRGYQYQLRCGRVQSRGGTSTCAGVWITRKRVESEVLAWLERYADDIVSTARQAAATMALPQGPTHNGVDERRALEQRITMARAGLNRLTDAMVAGVLPLDEYKEKRVEVEASLAEAEAKKATLNVPETTRPTRPDVRNLVDQWDEISVEARRDILSALITRIRIVKELPDGSARPVKRVVIEPRWQ